MHYYQCPYCLPSPIRAELEWGDEEDVMHCSKCEELFVATEEFLKEQKRKIKEG